MCAVCGFYTNILFLLFSGLQRCLPFEFLQCDPESYEPIRTDKGRCLKVNKGERIDVM